MYKIIDVFKSLFGIVRLNVKRVRPQVIFYYPQHFNRGRDGTNEFLKPLIDSCKKNNISYLVFEEPSETNAPRNINAIPFDFALYCILLLRKLLPFDHYNHFEEREWHISRLLRSFFFRKINPEIVITMSNSMLGFFRGWGDTIPIYDYQHGIIYSWHSGYMVNNKPARHIVNNRSKVLLFGEGFKKLLTRENDNYFSNNSLVIGTHTEYRALHQDFNRAILISLQITTANEITILQMVLMQQLKMLFQSHQSFYLENNIIFYLKHHPRFDGSFDISTILSFPFVKIINKPLPDCFVDCSVHLTFNSTTSFEAAVAGIPTLFLEGTNDNSLYEKEFQYPDFSSCLHIQERIEDFLKNPASYEDASLAVQNWGRTYYAPYDEAKFLELVNEKN